jgi:UDP-glucose 4-epimerase
MTDTVLVTGGAGFVGAHLVRRLGVAGHGVRVLDNFSTGSAAYLAGVPHELVTGTLDDPEAVARALEGVDAVVHLAARAGIPDSIADPLGTLHANVTATVALLDAARRRGVGRFILASTNAAVGDHLPPLHEDLPARPVSPYGASKLAGEAYVNAYAASFGMAATSLRFSNAYGEWSLHKKSVVAAWIRLALAGSPLTVYGDGAQTRDFVHAGDLADGVIAVLHARPEAVAGQVFGLGTGTETSVATLARLIADAAGGTIEVRHEPARAGDVPRSVSRIDKATHTLGWQPGVDLASGVRATLGWFRAALATPELAGITPSAVSGSD